MAKVFIGVPTFNRPYLVNETIASLQAQSFADFRVIVSDDGSTSEAVETVEHYIAGLGDGRITFHRQPANGGEYQQGRFFFAESAEDDLFMILHDDDTLLPTYLAEGVAAMDERPEAAFFVADAYAMSANGQRNIPQTKQHRRSLGRPGASAGLFDVLARHLATGFAPISGTMFRKRALVQSGFVDADCHGNYPFECNIFVRLGEIGSQAWYSPRELMGVRYHSGALRSRRELEIASMNATCIRLWSRRRFSGRLERRRRVILARYYRAQAMIAARNGAIREARDALTKCLKTFPLSPRALGFASILLLAPGRLRQRDGNVGG